MMNAYDKLYLEKARISLARMIDFAVYDLKQDLTSFFDKFIKSGVAGLIEKGDTAFIAGKSGVELAYEVMERCGENMRHIKPNIAADRSEEYWNGWAIAYYQWKTGMTFSEIVKYIPIMKVKSLYFPYHEMDIRQFADKMDEMYLQAKPETNLKLLRQRANLSQSELAEFSGISVRTIQQYEQRKKSINKAQSEYLIAFSKVLCCRPEELIEHIEATNNK